MVSEIERDIRKVIQTRVIPKVNQPMGERPKVKQIPKFWMKKIENLCIRPEMEKLSQFRPKMATFYFHPKSETVILILAKKMWKNCHFGNFGPKRSRKMLSITIFRF